MRYALFFSMLLTFTLAGCTRPAEQTTQTATTVTPQDAAPPASEVEPASAGPEGSATDCPSPFYYYNKDKLTLKIKPHFIIAGFQPGTSTEARTNILRQFPEYESATAENTTDAFPFVIVKLRSGTTCAQTMPLLAKLQQIPEVLFANPVFNAPQALGRENAWIGLTSEFMVNIKSGQAAALKALAAKTNTKIVDELGETTFLLAATKKSQGNALEMANFFHEQAFVTSAEPDFFVAAETGGLQPKKP